MKSHRVLSLSLSFLFVLPSVTSAQWLTNGNAVCTATGTQTSVVSAPDDAGGAIIAWADNRNGNNDIFAQRVTAMGQVLWTADGVAVHVAVNSQSSPAIAPDGAGGAIIFWQHLGNNGTTDIYAQHVYPDGTLHWPGSGVLICGAQQDQLTLRAVADGSGGAIVTWQDNRQGSTMVADVYAQRIDVSGTPLWTADGVAVCTAANQQRVPELINDGSGGAIIAWTDQRGVNTFVVYAQRIDSAGLTQWAADGVALSVDTKSSDACAITTDGAGGAIVVWSGYNGGVTFFDLFAQRINSSGAVQWTSGGVLACVAASSQFDPCLVPDGSGGVIMAIADLRDEDTNGYDLYAQRLNASGVKQWATAGVPIAVTEGDNFEPLIVSDGSGGAVVCFTDARFGPFDVYAQRINGAGAVQWTTDGVQVCTAANGQFVSSAVSDGSGGAIMAWVDNRGGPQTDVYAHRIGSSGSTPTRVPTTPTGTILGQNHPNPFNPSTTIEYTLTARTPVKIEIFDAKGARVASLDEGMREPGTHRAQWNASPTVSSGVYFYRLAGAPAAESRKMVLIK